MNRWTFGRKIGTGFAALIGLTLLTASVSIWALRTVVAAKDEVILDLSTSIPTDLRLETLSDQRIAENRGYLLTGDAKHLSRLEDLRNEFSTILAASRSRESGERVRAALDEVSRSEEATHKASEKVLEMKKGGAKLEEILPVFEGELVERHERRRSALEGLRKAELDHAEDERVAAGQSASYAVTGVIALGALATLVGALVAWFLIGSITRQVGSTVQHMRSSSAELQTAASQQATSTREQITAIQEMTTTMKELLATSRQIGESARQVAEVARRSAEAGKKGEETVREGQQAVEVVQRQVGTVVDQMLELGRKSGRIGDVVDLITELSEQTNILSVNATIEAAGAEGTGARFAAVAEEIRKLAERVGGSTSEIRHLVEEVRSAVHSTVMATESGSKAAEAAARQFADVTRSFAEIAGLVDRTAEAAREIELSTRQQTTAVEQVNAAVGDVAQASKETETSTTQTLQTATALASVSTELSRFVHSGGAA